MLNLVAKLHEMQNLDAPVAESENKSSDLINPKAHLDLFNLNTPGVA